MGRSDQELEAWLRTISDRLSAGVAAALDVDAELDRMRGRRAATAKLVAVGEIGPAVTLPEDVSTGSAWRATSLLGGGRRVLSALEEAGETADPRLLATMLLDLGRAAYLAGDIPRALSHYEEAERAFRDAAPSLVPRVQIDQARALLVAGVADEAARHLDEAIPVLREWRHSRELAEAEAARAAAALLGGEPDLAKRLAAAARRRFARQGHARWAGVAALIKLQADIAAESDAPLSRTAVALATQLSALGLPDEAAKATMLAARAALRHGSLRAAQTLLDRLPPARTIAPIDHRMLLRLCQAELALATGDHKRALAQARSGLAELRREREWLGGLDIVCGAAVHGRELGRLALGLLVDYALTPSEARLVLQWQERVRALTYGYQPPPDIDDPELADRVAELSTAHRTIQMARLDGNPTAQMERRARRLHLEVTRRGRRHGEWNSLPQVRTPGEIVERLGDRALVSFSGSGKNLAALVVSDGRTTLVRFTLGAEILELAKQLHADVDALAPDDLKAPLVAAVSASAERRIGQLDELLMAPLAALLEGRELVIVPFGGLYMVPWGALPSLRGRAISVAPSATAWVNAATTTSKSRNRRVVVVCGPGLPVEVSDLGALRALYPDAVVLTGEHATTVAVLSAMDGADLVHIAAHGTHEPANAQFSRLELADGGLLAHEMTRLHNLPKQVVLAACELAVSHVRPTDQPLGFADVLLAAGTQTLIAAVARVGDEAAATTMADYHRDHAAGAAPATALARTISADPLCRPFICIGAG